MEFFKSKEFFRLGENDVFSIVHFLYYMGFPIILFKAFQFGKALKLQSIVNKAQMGSINIDPNNFNMYGITLYDSIKGFIGGVIYFVIITIIWKIICELLFVFFRYFESNTKKE